MKFVSYKYWLNEKFTADSDPIHDMGIGVNAIIKKLKNILMRKYVWDMENVEADDIFEYCVESLKDKDTAITIIKHLVNTGELNFEEHHFSFYYTLYYGKIDRMIEVLKLLLNNNFECHINDYQAAIDKIEETNNPVYNEALDIIEQNILKGKNKNKQIFLDKMFQTAMKAKNIDKVKDLLSKGANPSKNNHAALREAIKMKNKELVEILIKYLEKDIKYK